MTLQAVLEKIGFHPYEASLYLAALELGESTVSELAHKSDMPRTSVQEVLGNMQKKGLVTSYSKQAHKYWAAEHPDKILAAYRENEEAFRSVLPQLQKLTGEATDKPGVKVYSGVREIKLIMDDIIETKHHIQALVSWDDWIQFFGEEYIKDFIKRRYSHFLQIKIITPRTKMAVDLKKTDMQELRQTKFLPDSVNIQRLTNFIYGNKIAIISLNKKEPTGIVIEDPDVVVGNQLYFGHLWNHSSDK